MKNIATLALKVKHMNRTASISAILVLGISFAITSTVQADPISVTLQQSQTIDGQNFSFNFLGLSPNAGPGVLTIRARGDYTLGFPGIEFLGVDVDSGLLTSSGIAPDNSTLINSFSFDDTEFERQIPISAAILSSILSNGSANVAVDLSGDVDAFNPSTAFVRVTLAYESAAEAIPEPTSMAVFGMMAAGGAFYGWRRRQQAVVA